LAGPLDGECIAKAVPDLLGGGSGLEIEGTIWPAL
jgi:hypothetical protein